MAIGDEYIGWSPDGRELVFAALIGTDEALVIAAADGSSVRMLSDGLPTLSPSFWQPTFSPDGEWIAFVGSRKGVPYRELIVVRPDGTGLRALDTAAVEASDGGGPVWSPDRTVHRLAYETFSGDALQMRVYDMDTETDHEVGNGFWPAWSPDGSKLTGCCASVWSMDDVLAGTAIATTVFAQGDGSCGEYLHLSGQATCSAVVFSPDGQFVISGDIAGKDLVMARADGTGEVTRIPATTGVTYGGFKIPLGWQPVWP